MAIKHTTSIFISKFGLVYKIIVYFLVIALIVGAVAFAVAHPALKTLSEKAGDTGFVTHLKSGAEKLLRGNGEFLDEFRLANESYGEWTDVLTESKGEWTTILGTALAALLVLTYLLALCFLPFSDILKNFMTSKSEFGFMSNLVANAGRAALYALFYTVLVFTMQAAIFSLGVFLFVKCAPRVGVLSLPVAYLVTLLLTSLKSTILSGWLPATVTENVGVVKGFGVGLKSIGKRFMRSFWTFVFFNLLLSAVLPLFGFLTFGIGFIIAVPSAFIMHRIVELVLYFDARGYRYYIDEQTVR